MTMIRAVLAVLMLLAAAGSALALQPSERLADPALEARARALSAGLRCLVCQNQSIDDSDAPLARDLRVLVRERLVAGDSDEQVKSFVVARYGEFVLLQPLFNLRNALLWLAPLLIGLAGLIAVWRLARRPAPPEAERLSPEEEAALAALRSDDRR